MGSSSILGRLTTEVDFNAFRAVRKGDGMLRQLVGMRIDVGLGVSLSSCNGHSLFKSLGLAALQYAGNRGGDQRGHQHTESGFGGQLLVRIGQRGDEERHRKTDSTGNGSGNHIANA